MMITGGDKSEGRTR